MAVRLEHTVGRLSSLLRGHTHHTLVLSREGNDGEFLRRSRWNEAVKVAAKVSHERTVLRRLEKLLAA